MNKNKPTESSENPFTNFVVEDAEEKAEQIVEKARNRARKLISEAREEAERIKEKSHQEGYEEGYQEGLEDGKEKGLEEGRKQGKKEARESVREKSSDLSSTLQTVIEKFENKIQGVEQEARKEMLDLAVEVAELVTKTKSLTDPDVLQNNLEKAIELSCSRSDITIYIPENTRDQIQDFVPELQKKFPDLNHVNLEVDGSLQPGGCRVVTDTGEIDAGIETQLRRVRKQLLKEQPEEDSKENDE